MADEQLIKRLKKDVQNWNQWRKANFGESIDLTGADLTDAILIGADLSNAELTGARFENADLNDADLSDAILTETHFDGANLSGANLSRAFLQRANLYQTNLTGSDLREARLVSASLVAANLSRAVLNNADLSWTDLSEAILNKASFYETDIWGVNFSRADLSGADLSAANVGHTIFGDVDLSSVKGLNEMVHEGPSYISIDTVYKSQGNIPFEFLRGAGVPDNFIEYMHSLTGTAFKYYSCFISYSTKNQEFAERLHADLQNKGVRCWFAAHDAKAGLKLDRQIDQAIRLHEKVLLILSPDSIKSDWVKREIKKAAKRQAQEKKDVLFPVSLVPFKQLQQWEYWEGDLSKDLAAEIREYLIPDFSNWKNHDAYKKAFAKLLIDLQSGKTKA